MREIRITAFGNEHPTPRDLRVTRDGEKLPFVRGFNVHAHIRDYEDHLGGPAVCLTIFHHTLTGNEELHSGPAMLVVEVPVWVQYVRNTPPPEPAEVPDGEDQYALLYDAIERHATSESGAAFLAALPLPANRIAAETNIEPVDDAEPET
jgi:hypothetical protein